MAPTLAEARIVIEAARDRAAELELRVSVAVVDAGGLVVALERMDGAPPLSAQIAEAKAQGAAVWHREGHALAEVAQARPAFVEAVSRMSRLPLIAGAGSLLIRDAAGDVVGAVGVSGAQPDEDRACAQAGLDAAKLKITPKSADHGTTGAPKRVSTKGQLRREADAQS